MNNELEKKVMAVQGAWKYRNGHMKKLIEDNVFTGYKVLEIGTWAGKSTLLWADACKNKGIVYTIDSWEVYDNAPEGMKQAVRDNLIFPYFLEQIKPYDNIFVLKGRSNDILPVLKLNTFDFIYIDGDHSYGQFKKDLEYSWPLLKDGGILCGDDFEVSEDRVDLEYARLHKNEDFIKDPKTRISFHPGITLALGEFNEQITVQDGFWHIRK